MIKNYPQPFFEMKLTVSTIDFQVEWKSPVINNSQCESCLLLRSIVVIIAIVLIIIIIVPTSYLFFVCLPITFINEFIITIPIWQFAGLKEAPALHPVYIFL